jgi:hypothetical protein
LQVTQNSAKARRADGKDPADVLSEPPDWNAPCTGANFYSNVAKIYRLLNYADRNCSLYTALDRLDFSPLIDNFAQLSHAERRLAIRALLNYRTLGNPSDAVDGRKSLLELLWQHPSAVLVLARKLLADFAGIMR